MTAQAAPERGKRDRTRARPDVRSRAIFTLPFVAAVVLVGVVAVFVSYVLWPTWPSQPTPLDAPAIPITVAGVLFDVPPAAIREAVQRHPGQHERVDLAFEWPSLNPPRPEEKAADKKPLNADNAIAAAADAAKERLFVTIAGLGAELPPLERLRNIYPRYIEAQATPGPEGLAVLPFRSGTPYDTEDLVYLGSNPEQFFARCTRAVKLVPGTCINERALGAAEITFRFPRDWLTNWHDVAAGIDRLTARLHPAAN